MSNTLLYSYYRSSCSWRVRIALALKSIQHEYKAVDIHSDRWLKELQKDYVKVNPTGKVPALLIDGHVLSESMSILEYLEDTRPTPALLPKDALGRSKVRSIVQHIVANIQSAQQTPVRTFFGDQKHAEYNHFAIGLGFEALEIMLEETSGRYCYGDQLTLADVCLVPQVHNAERFKVDVAKFPIISRLNADLLELDAFKKTHPFRQVDCPENLRID